MKGTCGNIGIACLQKRMHEAVHICTALCHIGNGLTCQALPSARVSGRLHYKLEARGFAERKVGLDRTDGCAAMCVAQPTGAVVRQTAAHGARSCTGGRMLPDSRASKRKYCDNTLASNLPFEGDEA